MKILGWQWQGNHPDHKERLAATRILRWSKSGLTAAFLGAIVAVYILDAIFFVSWAPDMGMVPVFLIIAITIRSCAVFAGPVMQKVASLTGRKKDAGTIRALSIAAGLLCLVPALSFFAGGHHVQTQDATIAEATTAVSDTNKAARIETLKNQIARIEKNRDDSISEANLSIQLIADDGVPGISPADNQNIALLRTEIQGYRASAATQIDNLESQIAGIEQEKEVIQTETAEATTRVSPADAIFAVLGSIVGDSGVWGLSILFCFAILIEAMAFFGLGAIEGLSAPMDEKIKRTEIEIIAHKAQVEAEHARQQALAEQELADIRLKAAEAMARVEAIKSGEDPEIYDAMRAAERNLKRAEANAIIAGMLRKAEDIQAGAVTTAPPVAIEPIAATTLAETPKPAPAATPDSPEPIVDELVLADPEPPPPPPEPNLTPAQLRGRAGGLAAGQAKAAARAKNERLIPVGDWAERDAVKVAAE